MGHLLQDLRFAARQLRRNPGFTMTAVVTLALGIGANAAMFTVIEGVLLRPLPYDHPERVVTIDAPHGNDMTMRGISLPNLADWRAQSKSFDALAFVNSWSPRSMEIAGQEAGQRQQVTLVTGSATLLNVFGAKPMLGRAPTQEEDMPGKSDVVVLSNDVWRKVFHADRSVLGAKVRIWGAPYTVLGVMPAGFSYPAASKMDVWAPAAMPVDVAGDRKMQWYDIIGRTRPGVSLQQAQTELTAIQSSIAKQYSDLNLSDRVIVTNAHEVLVKDTRVGLWALYAAVAVVWLIACVNVASLLMTRSVSRRHEMAIRGALGASRLTLARQLLTESFLLSAMGSVAGLGLAVAAIKVLWVAMSRIGVPLLERVRVDGPVLLMLVGLSLFTALVTGLVPAWEAGRLPARDGLRDSGSRSGSSRGQARLRDVLVVSEIALTLVLLASAGLLMRTLYALHHVPLGFRTENLVTGALVFPEKLYEKTDVNRAVFEPLLERLEATPGVKSAAVSSVLPMRSEFLITVTLDVVGQHYSYAEEPRANLRIASADMPQTLGIRMLNGRFFSKEDTASTPAVAVVNDAFVKKYFPGGNPLNHALSMGKKGPFATIAIIGVIDDVKQFKLVNATAPELYVCNTQVTPNTAFYGVATAFIQLAVRTETKPETMIPQISRIMRQVSPQAEMNDIKTMHDVVEDSIGSQTLAARLIYIFAGTALLVAIVGLYGLLAYQVNQRTREIGVRIALGARKYDVLQLIMRHAVWLLGLGMSAGLLLALGTGRILSSFIWGVSEHDGLTTIGISMLMLACGLLAAYVPARRAACIDPMTALRNE
jgi:predicted permease